MSLLSRLCDNCKFADWADGELWGCTHIALEECEDCKECAPNMEYYEDENGDVIKCCMFEERPEEIDEGRPYDKYRDNPRFKEY